MSYSAPRAVGLIEKASKVAIKHGVVYSDRWREFRGPAEGVEKATAELKRWTDAQESRSYRDKRSEW